MLALLLSIVTLASAKNTVTKVVGLLQEMLEQSKVDGAADRDAFAKYRCYCDQTKEAKRNALAEHARAIAAKTAEADDRRAKNDLLRTEVASLETQMQANADERAEATSIRDTESNHFSNEKADTDVGLDTLTKSMDMLHAVDSPSVSFLQRTRAASAGPGGMEGVLKTFHDTFQANLENAQADEEHKQATYDDLDVLMTSEWDAMDESASNKRTTIGDNEEQIATLETEVDATKDAVVTDNAFVAQLTSDCDTKSKEFEHRKMLRANEETAIAQAIAILNSDSAFSTFGRVAATSTGATSAFVQLGSVEKPGPLDKVLANIRKMIKLIDEEEATDVAKRDWCSREQTDSRASESSGQAEVARLEQLQADLAATAESTRASIADAEASLVTLRAARTEATAARNAANAQYQANVADLQDAETVLTKAIEVLTKYYDWLQSHNAVSSGAVSYDKHGGQDFAGGDLTRHPGASVEELEELCNHDPACKGFTSIGWLKGTTPGQEEWFSTSHDLYVKVVPTGDHAALLQLRREDPPATWGNEMEGQRGQGAEVLDMLRYITSETVAEREAATSDEDAAQGAYEGQMDTWKTDEGDLIGNVQSFQATLAETEQSLEEAVEDHRVTSKNLKAVQKYLAGIEPGCTFIQDHYESRKASRDSERSALNEAIDHLEATPAFA